jgi:putative transposase
MSGIREGFFLCRMRKQLNPLILHSNRPEGKRFVGMNLKEAKAEFNGDIVDFDVKMQYDHRRPTKPFHNHRYIRLRIIGVFNHEHNRYHYYVTNLPVTKMNAQHVAAVYAARWEVELLFRELKSQYRIEHIPSKNRYVSESLLYSALLCLAMSRRLYHVIRERLQMDSSRMTFDRWSILFFGIAMDLLELLIGPKRYYRYLETRLTEFIRFEVQDPNVKRKTLIQKAQIGVLQRA